MNALEVFVESKSVYDERSNGYTVFTIDYAGSHDYHWFAHRETAIDWINKTSGYRVLIRGQIVREYT